jgi:adenylate kinase
MATTRFRTDQNRLHKGDEIQSRLPTEPPVRPYRLVLLGAPGAGKGTQAELLSARFGARHVSTGDIFRSAKTLSDSERTPSMNRALEYMQRGELVPDDIMLGLLVERSGRLRAENGFLLDGFPRTVAQAEELERCLARNDIQLEAALNYELPLAKIIVRLGGRRVCPNCKAVYQIEARPPKVSGICDFCGSRLFQREDDRPESIRVRMDAYKKSTTSLTRFYRRKGLLVNISAEGTPEEIFERTILALQQRRDETSGV